ncbi:MULTISPECIES: hypothetical protein [unclassified Spiroplasma]|uniref:hypothetical protein n=1 Tax=unclassified Spiroplasma TaxID=2637901 RepID=UPI00313B56FD
MSDKLTIGSNQLNVIIQVNKETINLPLEINNVVKSNEQVLNEIKELLKDELDLQLNSKQTGQEALNKLIAKIKDSISNNVEITFRNKNDANNKIAVKNDEFDIDVKINQQIPEMLRFKLKNITESNEDLLNRIITNLNVVVDNKTTITTQQEIVAEIQLRIQKLLGKENYDRLEIKLENEQEINNKLIPNDNNIKIIIKVADEQQIININVKKVIASNNDILTKAIADLDKDITNWDTNKTYQQVLNFIKQKINNENINVTFNNNQQAVLTKLPKGTYSLELKLQLGTELQVIKVNIINLKQSSDDILQTLTDKLVTTIENKTTSDSYQKIIDEISQQLATIFDDDEITQFKVSFPNIKNLQDKLKITDNELLLLIKFQEQEYKVKLNLKNIIISADELEQVIANYLENNLDLDLTTSNKTGDVLQLIQNHFNSARLEILIKNLADQNRNLQLETDNIMITINIDNNKLVTKTIKLINIKESIQDVLKRLDKELNKDFINLTTDNTYENVLEQLQERIQDFFNGNNPQFVITIQDSLNLKDKLTDGKNAGVSFIITVGAERIAIKVNLLNVIKSNNDILQTVFNELDKKIINWDTSKTYEDILNEINTRINNPNIKVSFKEKIALNKNLSLDNNVFELELLLNNSKKTITMEVPIETRSHKDLLDFIKENININNKTTDTLQQDILNEVILSLRDFLNDKENRRVMVSLNDSNLAGNKLLVGTDKVGLKITIDNIDALLVINVSNTILSKTDMLAQIENLFQEMITAQWTTDNVRQDVLQRIKEKLQQLLPNDNARITMELEQNSLANNKLTEDLDELGFKVIIDDAKGEILSLKLNNIIKKEQQVLNDIIAQINKNIANKTTDSSYGDILQEIIASLTIDAKVKISLENPNDIDKKLVVNNNTIKIKVALGELTEVVTIVVNDVIESHNDILANLVNSLNQTIVNWKTDKTYQNLIDYLITNVNNENVIITFEDKNIVPSQTLAIGNHSLVMLLQLVENVKKVTINIIDVQKTDQEKIDETIQAIKTTIINKTTDSSYGDILQEIIASLTIDAKVKISLENPNDIDKKLVINNNTIKIKIALGAITEIITINVNDVIESDNDILTNLVAKLEKNIIGWKTDKTYQDVLEYVINHINNSKIVVSFKDNQIVTTNSLQAGEHNLDIELHLGANKQVITIKIVDVQETDRDVIARIINGINSKITGKTTDSSYESILNEIKVLFKDVDQEKILLQDWTENKVKLKQGDNKISLIIKSGMESKELDINIVNVILSVNDLQKQLMALLKEPIKLENITSDSLTEVVIIALQDYLKEKLGTKTFSQIDDISLLLKKIAKNKISTLQGWDEGNLSLVIKIKADGIDEQLTLKLKDILMTNEYRLNKTINKIKALGHISGKTTKNTIAEILQEIQEQFKDQSEISISLKDLAITKLNAGDNNIILTVIVGNTASQEVSILVKDVFDYEGYQTSLINRLQLALDNANLNTGMSFGELKKIITNVLFENETIVIENGLYGESSYKPLNENAKLKAEFIKMFIKNVSINQNNNKILFDGFDLKLNIKLADSELINAVITNINKEITGKTTSTNINDILREIQQQFKNDGRININFKEGTISKLEVGNNKLILFIKVGEHTSQEIELIVKDVSLSIEDLQNKIAKFLLQDFDFDLNSDNKYADALNKLQEKLKLEIGAENFNRLNDFRIDEQLMKFADRANTHIKDATLVVHFNIDKIQQDYKINLINIKMTNEMLLKEVINILNESQDLELTTDNTYGNAIEKLKAKLKLKLGNEAFNRIKDFDLSGLQKAFTEVKLGALNADDKHINIEFKVGTTIKSLKVKLINIQKTDQFLFEEVNDFLAKDIDLKLTTDDSFTTAIEKLKDNLKNKLGAENFKRIKILTISSDNQKFKDDLLGKWLTNSKIKINFAIGEFSNEVKLKFVNISKSQQYLQDEAIAKKVINFLEQDYDWQFSWTDSGEKVFNALKQNLEKYLGKADFARIDKLAFENEDSYNIFLGTNMRFGKSSLALKIKVGNLPEETNLKIKLQDIKSIEYEEIADAIGNLKLQDVKDNVINAQDKQKIIKFFKEKLNWDVKIKSSIIAINVISYGGKWFKLTILPVVGLKVIPFYA